MTSSIKYLLLVLILICSSTFIQAQNNLPIRLEKKLHSMGLIISIPTEGSYHKKKVSKSEFFAPDYIIRSKRKKTEIHYSFIKEVDKTNLLPQVHATTVISNLATNIEKNALIAVHGVQDELLLSEFNADWGRVIYFQPKRNYTRFAHGKLICLYKSGKGMAYVLFLFNQGGEDEVSQQFRAVKFED